MSRARLLLAGRIAFVLLTVGFAWWSFHGRWDEIADGLARTSAGQLVAAFALTTAGLFLTALLWRQILARLGSPLPLPDASAIFLVGQLGKYVPGSVWSFAAQAQLGRKHEIPARSSVAASAVFLMVHTFTGSLLGAGLVLAGLLDSDWPAWTWLLVLAGSLVALSAPALRLVGDRVAGGGARTSYRFADLACGLLLMGAVWAAYGAAVRILLGGADTASVAAGIGAFALSHAAGVLIVFAPAGIGAREGVLIALLGPVVGFGTAAAVALLGRVVHTAADFTAAGLSWWAVRTAAEPKDARVVGP